MIHPWYFRLLAASSAADGRLFLLLSVTGHVSLFPLLFTPFENVAKTVLVAAYSLASYSLLYAWHGDASTQRSRLVFGRAERFYAAGLAAVGAFEFGLHRLTGLDRSLPFLPLMLMSVYCAVGVLYVWFLLAAEAFRPAAGVKSKKKRN